MSENIYSKNVSDAITVYAYDYQEIIQLITEKQAEGYITLSAGILQTKFPNGSSTFSVFMAKHEDKP